MIFDTGGRSEHGRHPGSMNPASGPSPAILTCTESRRRGPWSPPAVIAFIAGGLAIVNHLWWLLRVCLGVVFLSVPAGKVAGIMGGTVVGGDPAQQLGQGGLVSDDVGSAADPGVDVGPRTPADRPAAGH